VIIDDAPAGMRSLADVLAEMGLRPRLTDRGSRSSGASDFLKSTMTAATNSTF